MLRLFAIGAGLFLVSNHAADPSVSPGLPVRNLGELRWFQGDPVEEFQSGRIYVIEFWSTWCGACIQSIDFMNDAARRYGTDATFVAIHIWPREGAPTPDEFFKDRLRAGKPVPQFSVADDVNNRVSTSWMEATESSGLPTVMIVDGESRLAWFGPAREIDGPLAAIIAGTFDHAAAATGMNRRIHVGRLARYADAAIAKGEYDRGMALMIEALDLDPDTVAPWIPSTYGHLVSASRSSEVGNRWMVLVRASAAGQRTDVLAGVANAILHFRPKELRDLALARALADQAYDQTHAADPHIVCLVASVRAEQGDPGGAVEYLELSLQTATTDEARMVLAGKLDELKRSLRK